MDKAATCFKKFAVLGFLGGAFISFGGLLTVVVIGNSPNFYHDNLGLAKFVAGALFPIGLMMVSIAGADLFTSNCAGLALPCLEKKIKFRTLLWVLLLSYVFNFLGAQFVAYFMAYKTNLLAADSVKTYLHTLSIAKMNQDFFTIFLKGIGANWLVCLGTWMGYAAKDVIGKCFGIWVPVMLFVTLGYEHSIANMFFIPAAIYTGAEITFLDFAEINLIPATLGNFVGGAFFVGALYWYVYLKDSKS